MKKMLTGLMVATLIVTSSAGVYAKPWKGNHDGPDRFHDRGHSRYEEHQEREGKRDARNVLERTERVIDEAQDSVRMRHRNRGLARAVGHQQRAIELYRVGQYQDAIFHSLRARDIAIQIMEANHREVRSDFRRDRVEEDYARRAPRDNDLDVKVDWSKVGNDDDAARVQIRLNLDL
jgi:HEPN domain-containing protein